MLDDAANVVEAHVAQVGILVAGEQWLAALPDRLVHVHARAIVLVHRLRHEGRRLTIGRGHVVDHVLVELHPVRHRRERRELEAKLVLRRGHFVVVLFGVEADLAHDGEHLAAHVLLGVDRRHGEVATLRARAVAHVAHRVFLARIDRQFSRVVAVAGIVRLDRPAHVIEDEEFGFRSEEHRVADTRRLHIGFGFLRGGARVAVIGLAGDRVEHVADHGQCRLLEERVDNGRCLVRLQQHVGFVDGLPAGNRRAIEHLAFGEEVFADHVLVEGDVLHLPARVGEAKVDILDVFVLHSFVEFISHWVCLLVSCLCCLIMRARGTAPV